MRSMHPAHFFYFRPRLLECLRGYDAARFARDFAAGITVAIVALPLAMAFAIASGLTPEAGIFTSIIAGFLISALGGSRVQIGGPAGAFIVIVYGIVQQHGLGALALATLMSGVILLFMGLFHMGTLVRFIPVAVIIGFTNGIAVLIALTQLKDFLGLSIANMPGDFFGIVRALATNIGSANGWAIFIALASLATLLSWQAACGWLRRRAPNAPNARIIAAIPGSIIALVLATATVWLFDIPVETIGSKFGGIPARLPDMSLPAFDMATMRALVPSALTLAVLGAIESLLCARVADSAMHGPRHDPNQELMAQGIANVAAPLFGGMPATGTIARTMTNVKNGATSPVSGMVHALALLLVVLLAAPLAASIPLATLAAILMLVAWNMGHWNEFARLKTYRLPYRFTLLTVFALTIIFDLGVAVEFGVFAAGLTFIYRISSLSHAERLIPEQHPHLWGEAGSMQAWRLHGALFFGATKFIEQLESELPAHTLVLDLKNLIYMDNTGAEALEELRRACQQEGVRLILSALRGQPLDTLRRTGLAQKLEAANPANLQTRVHHAITEAEAGWDATAEETHSD